MLNVFMAPGFRRLGVTNTHDQELATDLDVLTVVTWIEAQVLENQKKTLRGWESRLS